MSSTKTETQISIKKEGDKVTVKTITTTTTKAPGKDPKVEVVEKEDVYKTKDDWEKMPENVRKQVEEMEQEKNKPTIKPTNKKAVDDDFAKECLKEHNKYRKNHGVEPLKMSDELMKYSEKRAKELAEKDEMVKRTDNKYGECISSTWSNDPEFKVTAEDIVARFYSESKDYDYSQEPKDLKAGHFTQLIWKKSKEFGVAAAKSDTNKIYVVASYYPPGNYVDEFKQNVLPLVGGAAKRLTESLKSLVVSKKKEDSSSSSDDDDDISQLNKESVKVHNEYRKKHGVAPLKYSKELSKYAQEWADELAKKNRFEHRRPNKYGENLYSSYSSDPKAVATAKDACDSWYSEIKMHTFGVEPRSMGTGHFTQMIWKGTKEVGMGLAKSKNGNQIIVANYNPPGNFVGKYVENVPKPIS